MDLKLQCNMRDCYWNIKVHRYWGKPFCGSKDIEIREAAFKPECKTYIKREEAQNRINKAYEELNREIKQAEG
jgi:hypothetical protein